MDDTNLNYFGARYCDAEIGRFISEDPAKDGLNWYGYCNNNPLKFVDPTGLSSKEVTQRIETSTVEMNKEQYLKWNKYYEDKSDSIDRQKWITGIGGTLLGGVIALGSEGLAIPAYVGIGVGTGVGVLGTAKALTLDKLGSNLDKIDSKLSSVISNKDKATMSLIVETTSISTTNGNSTHIQKDDNYFMVFPDGTKSQIDKESYDVLQKDSKETGWNVKWEDKK